YPGPECGKIENLIRNGEAKGETLRLPFGEASPREQGILQVHAVSGGRSQVYGLDWSGCANPGGGRASNGALPDGSPPGTHRGGHAAWAGRVPRLGRGTVQGHGKET